MTLPLPVPTPVQADPVLGPLLDSLVVCVCAQLVSVGRKPCQCCLVWGDGAPAQDFCDCDCAGGHGQAWVRVVRWDQPPTVQRAVKLKCFPWTLRVWIEVGVSRCVKAANYDGTPPTCDDRQADAWGLVLDARALREGVACCAALRGRTVEFQFEEPSGPRGGCTSVKMQFSVDL